MAENTEPLEVLSIGIEADIRNLLDGAREGVKETAEILAKIPAAKVEVDAKALEEIKAAFREMPLGMKELNTIIQQGSRANATEIEKLGAALASEAKSVLDLGASFKEAQAAVVSFYVQQQTLSEESVSAVESIVEGMWEPLDAVYDKTIGLFEGITLSADEAGEALDRGFAGTLEGVGEWVGEVLEDISEGEKITSIIDKMLDRGHITAEMAKDVAAGLREVEEVVRGNLLTVFELSNGFVSLGLTGEEAAKIISQGSQESATSLERVGATLAEMTQIPSFALHLEELMSATGLRLEEVLQLLNQFSDAVGRVPETSLEVEDQFASEMKMLENILMNITLSVDEMNQLIQQGMRVNATETERWGSVLATELKMYMEMGETYGEALEEATEVLVEMSGMSGAAGAKLKEMIDRMHQFPEAAEKWSLEPVMDELGGIERHLAVVLRAQKLVNDAIEQGIQLHEKDEQGIVKLVELFHGAALTRPQFDPGTYVLWQDGVTQVRKAMGQLTVTQEELDQVIQKGTTSGADAYTQMAAVVAQVSDQTGMSLVDVTNRMMDTFMISRKAGLEIANVFESTGESTDQVKELVRSNLHSTSELSDGFINLGLTAEEASEMIARGSQEGASELERMGATIAELTQIPSFALHFQDLMQNTKLNLEGATQLLMEFSEEVGRMPRIGLRSEEELLDEAAVIKNAFGEIALSADELNQLVQLGMKTNATETERWGGVIASELQENLAMGVPYQEAFQDTITLFMEVGQFTREASAKLVGMISLMRQFPEAIEGWSFEQPVDQLGGVERQLGVVLKAQEFINTVIGQGIDLRVEDVEELVDLFQRATLTQPQFQLEPWALGEEATQRVNEAMGRLTITQEGLNRVIGQGAAEGANAYEQMAGVVARVSAQTGLSLEDVTHWMGETSLISRKTGLEIAGVFESISEPPMTSPALENIIQALNEITLTAKQTEIALNFTDEVHMGIAELVKVSNQWGVGLGEAGRQLLEAGREGPKGLEDTLSFLQSLVDLVNPVEELATALNQLQLTPELSEILTQGAVTPMDKLTADLVIYAEQTGKSLGDAARHFHELGLAGTGELLAIKHIIETNIGLFSGFDDPLEKIVQTLNKITLTAKQTEIALGFSDVLHEGIACLVEEANELGESLGEVGRRSVEMGFESLEGLEYTANFLKQMVSLVNPVEELIDAMGQMELPPGLRELVTEDPRTEIQQLTADIVTYAEQSEVSLGAAARHFHELGVAGEAELVVVRTVLQDNIRLAKMMGEEAQEAGSETTQALEESIDLLNLMDLTLADVEAITKGPFGDSIEKLAAELVLFAEQSDQSLGEAAKHFIELGQIGEKELTQILESIELDLEYVEKLCESLDRMGKRGERFEEISQATQETTQALEGTVSAFYNLTEQMLHARPAAVLATEMRQLGEDVKIVFQGMEADAKSMLELLTLGVPQGGMIEIQVDATNAVESIESIENALVNAELVAEGTRGKLQEVADTHINPSPLAQSIENITEALDTMNATLDEVPSRLKKIADTPLEIDLSQMEQLALPTPTGDIFAGRIEPLIEPVIDLQMALEPVETVVGSLRERLIEMFGTLKEGVVEGVSYLKDLVKGYVRLGEAADAASLGIAKCNEIIAKGAAEGATGMDRMVATIVRLSSESGESFESIAQGMASSGMISKGALKDLLPALKSATGGGLNLAGAFASLGSVAQGVFGAVIGLSAVQALRRLLKEMQKVADEAIRFQTGIVQLNVAVRAVQRQIGDTAGTMASWRSYVSELRGEFRSLGMVDLTKAAAQTVLLTREMGFNEEQMQQTLRVASTLAAVHGIEVEQAVTRVVRSLTGYGRGLYSLGVFMSRAQLNAEALAMGLKKTWTELDTQERATVALNVVMRQTEPLVEDLEEVYGSWGGRIQTVESATEDASKSLGRMFAPVVVLAKEAVLGLIETLATATQTLLHFGVMAAGAISWVQTMTVAIGQGIPITEALAAAYEVTDRALLSWSETFALVDKNLEDILDPLGALPDELGQDLAELVEIALKYGDQFGDALDQRNKAAEEAGTDLLQSLDELNTELRKDLVEAFQDYLEEMDELAREYQDRRGDIMLDAEDELNEIDQDQKRSREDAEADLNKKLIRLQEDYQRDARRLREQFVVDLKDAVAKRDVWGAVNLIKAFARERKELKENYDVNRRRTIEDHQDSMTELDRNAAERRQKAEENRARELAELEEWLAKRQAEVKTDHAEQEREIRDSNAEQEQELRDSYKERMDDLNESLEDRLVAMALAMTKEEDITAAGAWAVFQALFKVFGLGGDVDRLMDAFELRMAREINIRVGIEKVWNDPTGPIPGMAKGGTIIAKKPTTVTFGEAGTEMATFIPLNQLSRIDHTQKSLGILDIRVTADEYFSVDFEARVEESIAGFVEGVIQ